MATFYLTCLTLPCPPTCIQIEEEHGFGDDGADTTGVVPSTYGGDGGWASGMEDEAGGWEEGQEYAEEEQECYRNEGQEGYGGYAEGHAYTTDAGQGQEVQYASAEGYAEYAVDDQHYAPDAQEECAAEGQQFAEGYYTADGEWMPAAAAASSKRGMIGSGLWPCKRAHRRTVCGPR